MEQHEEKTQACLSIKNNQTALNCLKKVVTEYEGSDVCAPRLVLLTMENCEPCEGEEELLKDDIAKGIIKEVLLSSSEGLEISKKNDIEAVPAVLLLDCHNNLILPVE